mmetsp:Transcript_26877/g.37035  ORF Transcript_26877/g.37035 Transcript_26877/m.37035 type:complete len:214 (+) Transcript_26877:522-1163(+)
MDHSAIYSMACSSKECIPMVSLCLTNQSRNGGTKMVLWPCSSTFWKRTTSTYRTLGWTRLIESLSKKSSVVWRKRTESAAPQRNFTYMISLTTLVQDWTWIKSITSCEICSSRIRWGPHKSVLIDSFKWAASSRRNPLRTLLQRLQLSSIHRLSPLLHLNNYPQSFPAAICHHFQCLVSTLKTPKHFRSRKSFAKSPFQIMKLSKRSQETTRI